MLRGQSSHCRNIKGTEKYMGASLTPGHAHFPSRCDFMMGLGKPNQCTKFEVASFSRCKNIKGEAPHYEERSPTPGPHPLFF